MAWQSQLSDEVIWRHRSDQRSVAQRLLIMLSSAAPDEDPILVPRRSRIWAPIVIKEVFESKLFSEVSILHT